ncbi:MAG: hypothetical protein IPN44_01515 [Flavobacteriales bacterium]|nr:hypothetical protein [Flavobacteriales bacterium]
MRIDLFSDNTTDLPAPYALNVTRVLGLSMVKEIAERNGLVAAYALEHGMHVLAVRRG